MASKARVDDERLALIWFGEFKEEDALCMIQREGPNSNLGDQPTDERS